MYRITNEGVTLFAFGVCHECKAEARAMVWAQEPLQVVKPHGWVEFIDGRMQQLRCADCSIKEAA